MEFLRKTTVSLACFVLFISLTSLGTALAIRQTIGQPGPVERALVQANAYNAIVTNFIQSNQDSTIVSVPLSLTAIQTALQKAFPQSVTEPAINQVISATYTWAQGKTPTIVFRIDLSGAKTNLANYVQQAAEQQAARLPVCSYSQLLNLSEVALQDPLAISCLPPDVTSTQIGTDAKQTVLNGGFLKDPVLTPSSLDISNNYKIKLPDSPAQSHSTVSLPKVYRWLTEGLYASIASAIVCIAAVILLHRDRLRGLGRAGATMGWAGLGCLADALLAGEIPNWLKTSKLGTSSGGYLQQVVTKIISILAEDLHRWLLWYGGILFTVGLGVWIGVHIWKHRTKQQEQPAVEAKPPTENSPVQIS